VNAAISTLRLLGDHLRAGIRASLLVALLVTVTVFIVAIAPRAFAAVATDELRYLLGQEDPARLDVSGEGRIGLPAPTNASTAETLLDATGEAIRQFSSTFPRPLADGTGQPVWLAKTTSAGGSAGSLALSLRLAVDLGFDERLDYVSGAAPAARPLDADDEDPVDIAISARSASEMKVEVGDILQYSLAPLRIAGIYEPKHPEDTYWSHSFDLARPTIVRETGAPNTIQATVYVAPDSIVALHERFAVGTIAAWVPIDPMAYSFADRQVLATQVRSLTATPVSLPEFGSITFRSSFPDVIESAQSKVAAIAALMALSASGLFGVLVATHALSIQTLVRRRRFSLSLASARGASQRQLRSIMVIEAALIVVPGAAAAIAAAVILVPERVGIDGWLAPIGLAIIPIVLAAVLVSPGSLRGSRRDLSVRSTSSIRWVIEATIAGAAVVALVLLQRRGLVASSDVGVDLLLAATPLLLATAIGLLALRIFPIPLRAARALLRRGTMPVTEVGSARAIREPAIGTIAALALIVGVSIVVFSTIMISTVGGSIQRAAQEVVGADARVDANDLPDALVDQIRALPEVTTAAALTIRENVVLTDEAGTTRIRIVLVDPAELAAVRPDLPELETSSDSARPVLVSQSLADILQGTDVRLGDEPVQPVGVVSDIAIPGMSEDWLIIDRAAADGLALTGEVRSRLLIDLEDTYDAATVDTIRSTVLSGQPERYVGSVRVYDVRSELAERRAAPTTSGLEAALILIAVAALVFTMLIVALAAAASAAPRNRVTGVLRILGMTPRQIRALVAWEFGPVALAALLVGTALGVGLPYLVTAVVDLRAFFGGATPPAPLLVPLWIAAAVGIYALTILTTVLLAAALGRRFAPASTLKMGEP